MRRVEIDGVRYVPQENKIPAEALRLLRDLLRETSYTPAYVKVARLQYLLTDTGGGPR